mmetsp:Transcript_8924/g.26446  ORF Transcript_8924/g.26446 Transcript_8924/m.26446 type:complete len:205 (-) Transcript_8924:2333-2947(-)
MGLRPLAYHPLDTALASGSPGRVEDAGHGPRHRHHVGERRVLALAPPTIGAAAPIVHQLEEELVLALQGLPERRDLRGDGVHEPACWGVLVCDARLQVAELTRELLQHRLRALGEDGQAPVEKAGQGLTGLRAPVVFPRHRLDQTPRHVEIPSCSQLYLRDLHVDGGQVHLLEHLRHVLGRLPLLQRLARAGQEQVQHQLAGLI